MNKALLKKIIFLLLLHCFLFSCSLKRNVNYQPLVDFAVQTLWMQDTTCQTSLRLALASHLVENPIIGLDTVTIFKCFGEPIHRRYLISKRCMFIYFASVYTSYKGQPCGDLFVITFDKNGKTETMSAFFIEDNTRAQFWCSDQLPAKSYEFDSDGYEKFFYKMKY